MSRVDDLISRLCPDGVEFRTMNDVFQMRAGVAVRATDISALRSAEASVPCYGGNGIRGYVRNASHNGRYLLVGRQGALCGNVKRTEGAFYATEHAVVLSARLSADLDLDLDWAYHLLVSLNLNQYATKSAQPGLAVRNIGRLRIPVPPLEVQREIVRILDQFTQLEAELEAELEARQTQYAYYRELLLRQVTADRVPLADLGKWQGGVTPSKANRAYWDDGEIPWLASMDVSDTSTNQIRGRVTPLALKENSLKIVPAPSVAVVMRSNILRRTLPIGLIEVDTTVNQDMRALIPRDGVDAEYVYQALRADSELIRGDCVRTDGSMAAVESKGFFDWRIPLPSLDEQRHIAARLRAFDSLVNDLSIGLPAELVARRKQYEHYRGKLLAFKEAA